MKLLICALSLVASLSAFSNDFIVIDDCEQLRGQTHRIHGIIEKRGMQAVAKYILDIHFPKLKANWATLNANAGGTILPVAVLNPITFISESGMNFEIFARWQISSCELSLEITDDLDLVAIRGSVHIKSYDTETNRLTNLSSGVSKTFPELGFGLRFNETLKKEEE